MKKYGNKMIAEVGNYLTSSKGGKFHFLPYEEGVEYSEQPLDDVIKPIVNNIFNIGNVLAVTLNDHTKKTLVTKMFSNDDQIAIILNKDNSEYDAEIFNLMQGWRNEFSRWIKVMKDIQLN